MKIFVFAMSVVWIMATAWGQTAGTVELSDIDDVLSQKQELWNHIKADFDIFSTGDARMINRRENPKLNGARLGPYSFFAKPKGAPGPYTYEILINTKAIFVDKDGHQVPLPKASDFKEDLLRISIQPLLPEKYFTP